MAPTPITAHPPFPIALVMSEGRSSLGKSLVKSSSRSDPLSELDRCGLSFELPLELSSSPSCAPPSSSSPESGSGFSLGEALRCRCFRSFLASSSLSDGVYGLIGVHRIWRSSMMQGSSLPGCSISCTCTREASHMTCSGCGLKSHD